MPADANYQCLAPIIRVPDAAAHGTGRAHRTVGHTSDKSYFVMTRYRTKSLNKCLKCGMFFEQVLESWHEKLSPALSGGGDTDRNARKPGRPRIARRRAVAR
jgi:hypothetical protein